MHTGDVVVGDKMEFEDVCTPFDNSARIRQAHIIDNASEDALLYLVLFDRDFTETADKAVFAVSDADVAHVVAVIEFAVANYATFNTNSFCTMGFVGIDVNLPVVLVEGGTSLFGQLFAAATPNYTAITDLTVGLVIQ